MECHPNSQNGSILTASTKDNLANHAIKAPNSNSASLTVLKPGLENASSTSVSKGNSTEVSASSESQDTDELFRRTLAIYNTLNSGQNTVHDTLVAPIEHHTMFSTMKTVPLDMEKLKEDLSYYQYKLYQRFSMKLTDLVRLETLGKGAFGEVTRVFNKTDRKFYALKEIKKQSFKNPAYFERAVWTEIHNLLKVTELNDPSLLKTVLIDFDEDEETCYMLLELGMGTLEEYSDCMRAYGMTWKEEELEYILHLLISQMLKLKNINMYHRDIKPSNIIISSEECGFKLGDLGCACITEEGVQKLDIAGTPHYMSPEIIQAIMRREQIVEHDPYLSDLFSVGITMLMLIEPELKRNIVGKVMETVVKVKYPGLYPILSDLLGSPAKRQEGVQKFLSKDLKITDCCEFSACNLGDKYRLYMYLKIITKNKDIDTSFYFDMFIIDDALLLINKKIYMLTKDMNPDDQNLEEVIWRIRRARCYYMQMNYDGALKELLDIMERKELKSFETENILVKSKALLWLGMVNAKLGKMHEAIDNLMQCLGIRVAEFGEVHETVAAVFWQLGNVKCCQENFAGATKALKKCVEIGEKLDIKERKYMAKSLLYLGWLAELRGDHDIALEYFEKGRDTAINTHGEHHPDVADQYLGIAYVYIIFGRGDEGVDLYERALAIKKRWYGENNPEVAATYTKMAKGYDRLGDFNKALELLSNSVAIWKNVSGEHSQELADVYQFIGTVLCKKGHYLESLEYGKKVISNKGKHLGEENPRMAGTYVWYAEICSFLGLENDKQKVFEKFLAIDFDKLELNIDNTKIGFRAVKLLAEEGKIEKAWEYVQKGYQMCVNQAITKTAKTYSCYCEAVGRVRKAEGKYVEAIESVKEAISIRENLACKDPDIVAKLYSFLGDLYEELENNREALEWRKKCVEMIAEHIGKGGLFMARELVYLARVLAKIGKNKEAQEKLSDAKSLMDKSEISSCHPITQKYLELERSITNKLKPHRSNQDVKHV